MLTEIFPLPMSNNAIENTSADISFCNATSIFVLTFSMYLHKFCLQASVSSAAVVLGMTNNVWGKCLIESSRLRRGSDCNANVRSIASNARLYIMVNSSKIIYLFCSIFVIADILVILQMGSYIT